ncbi:hypothetical protein AB0E44_09280 [Micrococcus terreus]|uniref:hypothetical protein n=1 Tax=Micrococcus terreus TaxID=574650 RepID=UPI0033CFA4D0
MTITEKNLAEKLSEAFDGLEWQPVIDIIKEVTGHEFAPESKPLPTEPGSVIIATEVRGVKGEWRLLLNEDRDWWSPARINGRMLHNSKQITKWTPVDLVPEGELIDPEEVQAGDRVRVELNNGDEATVTVTSFWDNAILANYNGFSIITIRTVHLLHREEA